MGLDPTEWFVLAIFVGPLWGWFCRTARLPRVFAVVLAPVVVVAVGIELVVGLELLVMRVAHDFDLDALPTLMGAALPAVPAAYLLTRRDAGPINRRWVVCAAALLTPGLLGLIAGLESPSWRYADEIRQVEVLAPQVDKFIAKHQRCPSEADLVDLPNPDTDRLSFLCRDSSFDFCIFGGFDPVACWSSSTRTWRFH